MSKKFIVTWDSITPSGRINHNFKEYENIPPNSVANQNNYILVKKKTINGNQYKPVFYIGKYEVLKLTNEEIKEKGIKRVKTL